MGEAINNWPASETPVGVSAQHGRAALRDVAGTARAASAKIRPLNQFKDMSHVHITQISMANVSPMKRVNQTRTNVINLAESPQFRSELGYTINTSGSNFGKRQI